jgi:hypothetical protein
VVVLGDEEPEVFSHFAQWLYTGVLLGEEELRVSDSYTQLLDLYLFAEKMIVPSLQNDVIDAMLRLHEESSQTLELEHIQRLWDDAGPPSKMREFAIDQYVYRVKTDEALGPEYPHEFLSLFALKLWRGLWGGESNCRSSHEELDAWYNFDMWKSSCSRYHTHEAGEPSCEGPM